ncbi:RNA 2',3'-cyclic phosphodiesterase [Egicoccus sp. AB-alg6-2]|uniref:RNA 2',3'-cyclic phosphodiesterase n=1 Tax=Egicoccus sp. AB-alg6-2 TaxID=3242692 RepID=UPI00359EBC62
MRLFVALPVPDTLRTAVVTATRELRDGDGEGLRWASAERLHVTLAFLGEVAAEHLADAVAVVDTVATAAPPLALRSGEAGRFGRGVLWLGVVDRPPGGVADLGERLQAALADQGLPVERRAVRPHVTLGRGGKRRVDDALVAAVSVPPVAWRATSIQLWSSELGSGPARYTVEHEAPLIG